VVKVKSRIQDGRLPALARGAPGVGRAGDGQYGAMRAVAESLEFVIEMFAPIRFGTGAYFIENLIERSDGRQGAATTIPLRQHDSAEKEPAIGRLEDGDAHQSSSAGCPWPWSSMPTASTTASEEYFKPTHPSATLYEVATPFFSRRRRGRDLIYFQATPRPEITPAPISNGLDDRHLHNFRQELHEGGAYLLPASYLILSLAISDRSDGPRPINQFTSALNRYLQARTLVKFTREPRSGASSASAVGRTGNAGRTESAGRENLDNGFWGCELQLAAARRPVRHGKIIQELEGNFSGRGWNVTK